MSPALRRSKVLAALAKPATQERDARLALFNGWEWWMGPRVVGAAARPAAQPKTVRSSPNWNYLWPEVAVLSGFAYTNTSRTTNIQCTTGIGAARAHTVDYASEGALKKLLNREQEPPAVDLRIPDLPAVWTPPFKLAIVTDQQRENIPALLERGWKGRVQNESSHRGYQVHLLTREDEGAVFNEPINVPTGTIGCCSALVSGIDPAATPERVWQQLYGPAPGTPFELAKVKPFVTPGTLYLLRVPPLKDKAVLPALTEHFGFQVLFSRDGVNILTNGIAGAE